MKDEHDIYSEAAEGVVDLGNKLAEAGTEDEVGDISDGLIAGAVQFWLYANQPCNDPKCEDCESIATAESRLEELIRVMKEAAEQSEYYHSPNDRNVGRA